MEEAVYSRLHDKEEEGVGPLKCKCWRITAIQCSHRRIYHHDHRDPRRSNFTKGDMYRHKKTNFLTLLDSSEKLKIFI